MFIKEGFIKEEAVRNDEIKLGEWGMHGDVIIQRVDSVPVDFEELDKEPNSCLAYGEATGHAHKLFDGEFDVRIDKDNESVRHLKVVKPVALRHQEHKEIILKPGNYITRIQREYDPFGKKIREVAD
jgi:hypothetical protein